MERQALISQHIILASPEHSLPVYGIILIEGETISDIIIKSSEIPIQTLLIEYSEWNPVDFSEYYISPGLIDLNIRKEFETYEELTKAAISGGCTFLLEHDNWYSETDTHPQLFTDIGKLATINIKDLKILPHLKQEGYFGFKINMFPTSYKSKSVKTELTLLLDKANEIKMPIFVDPSIPNPRMLYLVSPLRNEAFPDRCLNPHQKVNLDVFAAAFPEVIDSSDEEKDEEFASQNQNIKRYGSSYQYSLQEERIPDLSLERSVSGDDPFKAFTNKLEQNGNWKLPETIKEVEEHTSSKLKVSRSSKKLKPKQPSIHDDLSRRIHRQSRSTEALSLAEQSTYEYEAPEENKTFSFKPNTETLSPPLKYELKPRRPMSILTKFESKPIKEYLYSFHLANYPSYWETAGITKLVNELLLHPCQVHLCNVSSSSAYDEIWKATQSIENLTCDVTASELFFIGEEIKNKDTRFKNLPVIRNKSNNTLVWELLKYQSINIISSGHACIEAVYKDVEVGNFQHALNGINCVSYTMLSVWTKLNEMEIESSLEHYIVRLSKWMSSHPAKVLNIEDERGSIEKGKLADLIIWKPYEKNIVEHPFGSCPETNLYSGLELKGKIYKVYLRGKLAFDEGKFSRYGRHILFNEMDREFNSIISQLDGGEPQNPAEILPDLFLSSRGPANNEQTLDEHQISHILNLTGYRMNGELSCPNAFPEEIEYKHIVIEDEEDTPIRLYFEETYEFIEEGRISGKVLVHCEAGMSRSPTIVLAYLLKRFRISLQEAYEHVKLRRPVVYPNAAFCKALVEFEKEVLGSCSVDLAEMFADELVMFYGRERFSREEIVEALRKSDCVIGEAVKYLDSMR